MAVNTLNMNDIILELAERQAQCSYDSQTESFKRLVKKDSKFLTLFTFLAIEEIKIDLGA